MDIYDYIGMDYGRVESHLAEVLKDKGITKSTLARYAHMQMHQVDRYCDPELARVDLEILARICTLLNCSITDILHYIPPKNE